MAGSTSDYFELEVLDWACGNTNDLGTPNTAYCALYTVAPTDSTAGTEVTGGDRFVGHCRCVRDHGCDLWRQHDLLGGHLADQECRRR